MAAVRAVSPTRQLVRLQVLAAEYDLSLATLRSWIRTGRLQAFNVGGRAVRVDRDEFERLITPVENAAVPSRPGRRRAASLSAPPGAPLLTLDRADEEAVEPVEATVESEPARSTPKPRRAA